MQQLIITWQGLLFEAVAFLIFTYLINLFLFKPIRNIIKKRQELLNSNIGKQKDYESSVENILKNIEDEKKEYKLFLNKLREDYHKTAVNAANEILDSAKKEAMQKFDEKISEIKKSKESILESIKSESASISKLIANKIIME
ncbi:MAG: ATP synthase F0 subunit B [bacterium]